MTSFPPNGPETITPEQTAAITKIKADALKAGAVITREEWSNTFAYKPGLHRIFIDHPQAIMSIEVDHEGVGSRHIIRRK